MIIPIIDDGVLMWSEYMTTFNPIGTNISLIVLEFVLYMTAMFLFTAVFMGTFIYEMYRLTDKYSELGRQIHHLSNPFDDPWNLSK